MAARHSHPSFIGIGVFPFLCNRTLAGFPLEIGLAGLPGISLCYNPNHMATADRYGRQNVVEVPDCFGRCDFWIDGIFIGFYFMDTIENYGNLHLLVNGTIESIRHSGELK